jgi:hypothetical protein
MPKWLVRLKRERFDLEDLPSLLRSPELNLTEDNGFYYLHPSKIQNGANFPTPLCPITLR